MTTVTLNETGTLKRNLVEMAFEECGTAGYEFDRTPEEVNSALRKLNFLMAEWASMGIALGYIQPNYGVGQAEEASGIPDSAVHVVALYLALRIAPNMGKALSPETKAAMSRSWLLLQSQYALVPSQAMPSVAVGAGRRGLVFSIPDASGNPVYDDSNPVVDG